MNLYLPHEPYVAGFQKRVTHARPLAWLALVAALAFPLDARASSQEAEPLRVTEVAPGVFVHVGVHQDATPDNLGDIANIGFIVGERGVAVVDTGNTRNLGLRLREAVRAETDLPILYVINTHVHPDHIFGNAAFSEDSPEFVGHAKLTAAMANRGPFYLEALVEFVGAQNAEGTEIIPPSLTVEAGRPLELDLGGRSLRLTAHPTAHTDNDLTVTDVATGTLWTGDLVFVERIPSIDGSLLGWVRVLEELRRWQAERIVPGHGPATADWPKAMADELRYFSVLLRDIRKLIRGGGTIEEAVAVAGRKERTKWALFDDYNPRNVTAGFVELEWE
ncbi:MAG: quinoprotein relay system zinc metallohydrolase 2 [Alphaproteobacteria bacterium]